MYAAAERFPGPTRTRSRSSGSASCPTSRASRSRRASSSRTFSPRRAAGRISSGRCCARPRPRSSGSTSSGRQASPISAGRISSDAGRVAYIEIRNDRHLNAEDCDTSPTTETAVDLALLDPDVEIGVIRGAVVSHPRYAGQRVFGAGLNLTHLYHGRLDFMFFVTRDLGYVNKLFRGLSSDEFRPAEPEQTTEKLWVAAVETFAIGGACQILHTVDHVIATRGTPAVPARAQGGHPPRRRRTCDSRARSATGSRGRRSSPGSSSRPERRTATCSATKSSSRPPRWTQRSQSGSRR